MEPSSRPLYLVCTREVVYNWLDRNPNGRPMIVLKRRRTESRHDLRWYWVNQLLACSNNTSIPPIISPYDRGGSTFSFGTHPKLTCMKYAIHICPYDHAYETSYSSKHATHSSYQRFKHACLVRSSRSLARRSLRLRHLLRYLRYKRNRILRKYVRAQKVFQIFFK